MSAPAVEAATVIPQRRLIAAGIKRGSADFAVEYPPMSPADKAAHAAASYVRPARPVSMTDEERDDLSKKLAERNKHSSRR
ncbi:hypothetical protein [Streptomyces gardneri]|uniref:hypothetical protein n=1 Tax=Streptomyces gardneri TaxID=66892 RepID=UPI0035E04FC7